MCEPGKAANWHRALGSCLFGKQWKQIVLKGNFVTAHSLLMEVFWSRNFLSAWYIDRESRALLLTGLCQQVPSCNRLHFELLTPCPRVLPTRAYIYCFVGQFMCLVTKTLTHWSSAVSVGLFVFGIQKSSTPMSKEQNFHSNAGQFKQKASPLTVCTCWLSGCCGSSPVSQNSLHNADPTPAFLWLNVRLSQNKM